MSMVIELAEKLLPRQCLADTYKFTDVECLKALVSKGLGFGIIAGSLLVKVPQITKILNNKSAAGLNFVAVLFEILSITFHLSYNYVSGFPFSAYGDAVFLALQTIAIGCLVLYYGGSLVAAVLLLVGWIGLGGILVGGLTPLNVLWTIQTFNIPIMLAGKSMQAFTNFRNGSTGQLSAVTCFMLFFGSLARIFTSYQETGDAMMILMYVCSTTANAVIVAQLLWYWNAEDNKKKATVKKQQGAKSKAKKSD